MNIAHTRLMSFALGLWATALVLSAQVVSDATTPATDAPIVRAKSVQSEALQLIREDTKNRPASDQSQQAQAPLATPDDVVTLEPFVVREDKVPDLSTPRETPTEKFFRTGTVAQHVGEKVTTRLWVRGDSGVMLSFSW